MSQEPNKPSDPKGPKAKGQPSPAGNPSTSKNKPGSGAAPKATTNQNVNKGKVVAPPPPVVPPLFRKIDWITFTVTTLIILIGYYLTLAPELTLEDSGELATGAFYAGVPHPPGYPVWTVYSWIFTRILPFHNIAWRVAFASALAGALACGLVGLLVSRGSSMMLESIEELKNIERRAENWICLVCGLVGGALIGFNGFMWSQAVIVEVYTFGTLSLMGVLCCLLRWIYAPHQYRYLYLALFLFGVCFTNHQTLIVAAMGIQVGIIAANPRLGRDMLLANSFFYVLGLWGKSQALFTNFDSPPESINMMFVIFNVIGLTSIIVCSVLIIKTQKLLTEWKPVLIMGLLWFVGAGFYFYMPLASMSNPPMNWGYPRTAEGFMHALTRGQYEKANPSNIIQDPGRFVGQVGRYLEGAMEEVNIIYLVIALVPFLFYFRLKQRERAWLLGLAGVYFCLAILLLVILNPAPDRQSLELNRVFFTASHFIVAMGVGYGLALIAATLIAEYEAYRRVALICSAIAAGLALLTVMIIYQVERPGVAPTTFLFLEPTQDSILRLAAVLLLALFVCATILFAIPGKQVPLGPLLSLFCLMPLNSVMNHWADNEEHDHLYGFWFGHDMFTPPFKIKDGTKPLYPEMAKDAILFGGTDPGRFAPTYMIFCESFVPPEKKIDPNFDRRDVYIITQNALADGTYLNYIRAHYNRSTEIDPYFFGQFLRSQKEREEGARTNLLALAFGPVDKFFTALGDNIEKERRAGSSFFTGKDFTDLTSLKTRLAPGKTQDLLAKYLHDNLSPKTQSLLSGNDNPALGKSLAKDLNTLLEKGPLYSLERFASVKLSRKLQRFLNEDPKSHTLIRLNRELLEEAYPKEIAKSVGGVFPDLEIHTPSTEDSQKAFEEYVRDAQRRLQLNQLRPGEDVHIEGSRLQVSGQVAVMAINGLLTRVIFDKNPENEFYVEESFPLDWMYPYETPYGIIMKINREPVKEITQEMVDRDHSFWTQYSERLIGNWVTYDTSVKDICEFAERVYHRKDVRGYKGSPTFLRDDQAQKAFSKLRSAIGGLYAWRINHCSAQMQAIQTKPPAEQQKLMPELNRLVAEQQRLIRETDFAYRQSFAFCPYSPEAVFRYVNLLLSLNRAPDAYLIAKTCLIFDPDNTNIQGLTDQLKNMVAPANPLTKTSSVAPAQTTAPAAPINPGQPTLPEYEAKFHANPTNLQDVVNLVSAYIQLQRTNDAEVILDGLVNNPKADVNALMVVAQAYAQLVNPAKLEVTLTRLTQVTPDSPEAWYDLAAIRAVLGKNADAVTALKMSIQVSDKRFAADPHARNLRTQLAQDTRFGAVRNHPDIQKLLGTKK